MGSNRNKPFYEAAWWTPFDHSDRHRNFSDPDAARAWLAEQLGRGLHEWIIRRRSSDGWRAVASGTAEDLRT